VSDYVPTAIPGHEFTYTAGAAITGGQVVHITATGRVVSPTGAASNKTVGIAVQDVASGASFTVSRGGIQLPKASGAITAGVPVKSAAAGCVAAWVSGTDAADLIVGVALSTVIDGAIVETLWRA
jgi:predicted RecA/RadA family phage recombinase